MVVVGPVAVVFEHVNQLLRLKDCGRLARRQLPRQCNYIQKIERDTWLKKVSIIT